jgi:hypothetical protein
MAYWTTSSFVPFDDAQSRRYKLPTTASQGAQGVIFGTTDNYRQGVDIRTTKQLFESNQPKLWGGRVERDGIITHESEPSVFGQAVSFTEFFGTHYYDDRLATFQPVEFITLGDEYPYPIIYNDGPQVQQESVIEPLTIPMRLPTNEGLYHVHDVHGALEDGNLLDGLSNGNSRIEQYIPFSSSVCRPFLDDGEIRLGDTPAGSVYIEGYQSKVQRLAAPYNDTSDKFVLNRITSFTASNESSQFKNALLALSFDTNSEEDKQFGKKGSPAGFTVYGPSQAIYGRDSIAFVGRLKGS